MGTRGLRMMKNVLLLVALFPGLVIGSQYYRFNDGTTMTQETIGDVTYYRTSDGQEFTSTKVGDANTNNDDLYSKYLNKNTPPVEIRHPEGLRFWRDKSGNQIEAKLIRKSGAMVVLELADGTRKTVPLDGLSDIDQRYVGENALPDIGLDVGRKNYDNGSYDSVRFRIKAQYKSTYDFPHGINIHFFVFSESDELIRHEHRDDVVFEGDDRRFEFETSAFSFLKSTARNANQSSQYGGYLVVVTDDLHRIISSRYTNEKAKQKLDKLIQYGIKKIQVDRQLPFRELSPYNPSSRL